MEKQCIKFGIVGCGVIGPYHANAIAESPLAELVACADIIPERAQALAAQYNGQAFASLEEMLAQTDIEALCICTPSGLHAEHGMIAAQAGRHVLVEKPLDVDLARTDRLIAVCEQQGVKLGCIFQSRTTPAAKQVKQAIEAGLFGRIVAGTSDTIWHRPQAYYDSGEWRGTKALDGGCLWNQGVHYIDLLCWMLGDYEKVLCAHQATVAHTIEVSDFSMAQVRFCNGAVGMIRVTTANRHDMPQRLEIYGTKGSAVILDNKLAHFSVESGESLQEEGPHTQGFGSNARAVGLVGHAYLVHDFAEAILTDRVPYIPASEGRQTVQLLSEIDQVAEATT